ncbi:protein-disulfide reductase DsbD [Xylella fastidiosa]|uniref:Protein-disulfide reductase DsbD n=1 Tax=Xylella fastidiosa TaxID=2371 RepID=A0ABC8AC77_XYLFS|nr:protein-disulfide reductase DsbD [Xylella fastidiosa]ALR03689.1 protein-disulfide reductase DsbD [Xylella fastidiosa]ALR05914.1 protein-disulfide reductase DsbD [Xylella fastidiosa]KXB21251.1 cytochrome C biogenesis protein [Xylella fastidiosa]OJZ72522.1 cytochrome C biogenesis protein [Xylella fastidiosa 6c]
MTFLHRLATLCVLALISFPVVAVSETDLLPVEKAFVVGVKALDRHHVLVHWKIAEGYYLYRHRIAVRVLNDGVLKSDSKLNLPNGYKKNDSYLGDVEIYRGSLTAVRSVLPVKGVHKLTLQVNYQGCADAGVCYPPQVRTLHVALPTDGNDLDRGAAVDRQDRGSAVDARPLLSEIVPGVRALPLPAEQAFGFEAIVGDGNHLLLRFTPAKGYYLYRDRTSLALEGDKTVHTGVAYWPQGSKYHDEHFGDVVVYFNQIEVMLPLQRDYSGPIANATLVATFQGCQIDGICYPPMTRRVRLSLPSGKVSSPNRANAIPLMGNHISLQNPLRSPGSNVPPGTASQSAVSVDSALENHPSYSASKFFMALSLALVGGLLLNLLPCVLPVLSLKVLALAKSGESRACARRHAIWYTAGVLLSFGVIGGIAIMAKILWGFQLQQPGFVGVLVYLMFAVGLSLSGVFTMSSTKFGAIGQSLMARSGPLGDFFAGVLACVVSSACIGPFMGPALVYAFTAPPLLAMLVFLTLGFGLALPFLLLGFVPSLTRRLPTPGPWMQTLKYVLALPMYLTTIWLLWVLGKQRGVDAQSLLLVGLVMLAMGLCWFERSRWNADRWGLVLSSVLLFLTLLPLWGVTQLKIPHSIAQNVSSDEVAYSPLLLDRLRADNRVVFVNVTADWCVTCKANERNVLSSDAFHDVMHRIDAVYMKGDWTNGDVQISSFLSQHQAVGVPLYVVYGPGAPPNILPNLLTKDVVEDALLRAAR